MDFKYGKTDSLVRIDKSLCVAFQTAIILVMIFFTKLKIVLVDTFLDLLQLN